MRFHQERIAFMGDIESMFYQVHIPESQRNFVRFSWWPDGDLSQDLTEYHSFTSSVQYLHQAVQILVYVELLMIVRMRLGSNLQTCYDETFLLTITFGQTRQLTLPWTECMMLYVLVLKEDFT